ncbi:MAG: RNA 2',3'-cyclic phosphodiesterase [Chloroflexi bacterium]|nr:RNA 2',3'-cyclic phosphodiesterase [Chloroflexota bacterium]
MPEPIRTFIAIELDDAIRRALGKLQTRLQEERAARYVRWSAPEGIHLTLKFLGGVDADKMPALQSAISDACKGIPPFELTLAGLGAFPNTRRPNVVWVGMRGDVDTAARLAAQIDAACAALRFAREARPFSPHLTLGRVKRDVRPNDHQFVGEMVAAAQADELGEMRVERVSVMKSDLRPTGSVYTQLFAVELG